MRLPQVHDQEFVSRWENGIGVKRAGQVPYRDKKRHVCCVVWCCVEDLGWKGEGKGAFQMISLACRHDMRLDMW